jgi:alkanesulfonate monooxygenase SsuD/methylene tetrahydromethanopterin reductase-like flavin-dependent oxidoreductase (luciferase family)
VSLGLWQDRPPGEVLRTAQVADELGYGEIWIGEMATFDAFALGAVVAERTARASLTVGPLAVAVRDRHGRYGSGVAGRTDRADGERGARFV